MKTKEDHIDFENSIGPWMGMTVKMVEYYLQALFNEHGLDLSKEQMVILKKLHEHNGLNQNELASLTFRDKSSMARLLSKMEKKNHIHREQSEEDKRINLVFLTDKGRSMFKQTRPVLEKLISTMEENITMEEKKMMIKILKKVQFNFTQEKVAF
ncbi:MAG: MarR family transcriptional regulator [Maribacter sp.]|nr:MarR family transcriptional regulator [Maribacter sp.]